MLQVTPDCRNTPAGATVALIEPMLSSQPAGPGATLYLAGADWSFVTCTALALVAAIQVYASTRKNIDHAVRLALYCDSRVLRVIRRDKRSAPALRRQLKSISRIALNQLVGNLLLVALSFLVILPGVTLAVTAIAEKIKDQAAGSALMPLVDSSQLPSHEVISWSATEAIGPLLAIGILAQFMLTSRRLEKNLLAMMGSGRQGLADLLDVRLSQDNHRDIIQSRSDQHRDQGATGPLLLPEQQASRRVRWILHLYEDSPSRILRSLIHINLGNSISYAIVEYMVQVFHSQSKAEQLQESWYRNHRHREIATPVDMYIESQVEARRIASTPPEAEYTKTMAALTIGVLDHLGVNEEAESGAYLNVVYDYLDTFSTKGTRLPLGQKERRDGDRNITSLVGTKDEWHFPNDYRTSPTPRKAQAPGLQCTIVEELADTLVVWAPLAQTDAFRLVCNGRTVAQVKSLLWIDVDLPQQMKVAAKTNKRRSKRCGKKKKSMPKPANEVTNALPTRSSEQLGRDQEEKMDIVRYYPKRKLFRRGYRIVVKLR